MMKLDIQLFAEQFAQSDVGIMLYVLKENAWTELVGIKSAPATGGAPELLDATELKSKYVQNIFGRQSSEAREFDYNYTISNFKACKELEDGKEHTFLIIYGDKSGDKFSGNLSTWVDSVSANQVVNGKLSISVTTHEWVEDVTALEPAPELV